MNKDVAFYEYLEAHYLRLSEDWKDIARLAVLKLYASLQDLKDSLGRLPDGY